MTVGAPPTSGPCTPWTTDGEVRECCGGLTEDYDLTSAIEYSSSVLYRLSGRQWSGPCERTVRPCYADNCGCKYDAFERFTYGYDGRYNPWSFPVGLRMLPGGQVFAVSCCNKGCNIPTVTLPAPVSAVTQVVIDGVILDPAAYKVVQYRYLARVDGETWPCWQDLTKESDSGSLDAENTWQISYTQNKGPDSAARYAASVFACQIAKGQCGDDGCELPQRLQTIIRDGVSMTFADPLTFLQSTTPPQVGLYEVDLWLRSVNPSGLHRRSTVRRADKPPRWKEFT